MSDPDRDRALARKIYVGSAEDLLERFVTGQIWPDALEATRALAVIHLETLRIVRETAALAKGRTE